MPVRFLETIDSFSVRLLSFMLVASDGRARGSHLGVACETDARGLAPGGSGSRPVLNEPPCAASSWRLAVLAAPPACPGLLPRRAALSCSGGLLTQAAGHAPPDCRANAGRVSPRSPYPLPFAYLATRPYPSQIPMGLRKSVKQPPSPARGARRASLSRPARY